jgi:hypothetical protein
MKKGNTPPDMATTYAKQGKKMAIQPKQGEPAKKQLNVGRASTMVDNGIFVPKPTTSAKAPVPAPTKQNWKAPTSKQTGMKKAMKVGGKGRKC